MSVLVDTNVLTRIAEPNQQQSMMAADAVRSLLSRGEVLNIVPQCVYEFWVVATRPVANNGLAMTTGEASAKVDELTKVFVLLPDTAQIFAEWRRIVLDGDCHGKIAHDARLVAAMRVHRLDRILTFNGQDFSRFAGINLIDPARLPPPMTGSP